MQDATDEFEAIHSAKAKSQLQEFIIGKVGDKSSAPANEKMAADTAKVGSPPAHLRLCQWPLGAASSLCTKMHACQL